LKESYTLGSLFDGIGGFPYAASFYGVKTLWASEIIPECIDVTKRHFPDMVHVGDITKLHGNQLAPVDIITFGSPCQGLSQAGLRRGLADERSGLFMEAIRIIQEMKEATNGEYPKFAVWENVVGALSSSGRRDFKAVLEAFTEAEVPMPCSGAWANAGMVRSGGVDLAWCVYDAQYFGTAQRRRRLFLIADFRGKCAGQVLFVPKSLQGYFEAGGTPKQGLAAYAQSGAHTTGIGIDGYNAQITGDVSATLGVNCGMSTGRNGVVEVLNDQGGDSLNVERKEISPTLRCQAHGNLPIIAAKPPTAYTLQGSMIGRSDENGPQGDGINQDVSFTLNTVDRHAVCMATGQTNAEVLENKSPTLVAGHEHPIVTYPKIAGTLCASGAGLSRPAGMCSETDFCIVQTDVAAVDCRNMRETPEVSGTLQAKAASGGYSLNYQNPVRTGYLVRRLTPTECERLQGFPDDWTKYGASGKEISDSKRYQMLGNSVAVPCVAYLLQGITDILRGDC
jgi:DNA (cytosine-5)-methyltransferase 1